MNKMMKYWGVAHFDAADDKAAADEASRIAAEKVAADAAAKAIADKEAADAEAARIAASKIPEAEAKLLKEVMAKKKLIEDLQEKLKGFDGVDPTEFKKLTEQKKEAEKAKKDAEKKAAEAAGDIDRVKKIMVEEHERTLAEAVAAHDVTKQALAKKDAEINDLTVGQAFNVSPFVTTELVLTPTKARAVYGAYFESKDGKVVGYDKPAGAAERTELIDGKGKPLPFEAAIRKLVESDADRDHMLKSKIAAGAGSKPGASGAKVTVEGDGEPRGLARLSAALAKSGFGNASKK